MEDLYMRQSALLGFAPKNKKRYLFEKIDPNERLIGIKGARGTGKTTLLLQLTRHFLQEKKEALYVTLDDLYFLENTLVDLAKDFSLRGGSHLFLDEVHKYPRWSRELKLIYDQYPQLKIVFTSSSMLEIYKGESDLSRRAITYILKELSFREFLEFKHDINLPVIPLKTILENHKDSARQIIGDIETPIKFFSEYIKNGVYPYYFLNKATYHDKLVQTVQVIIENDMNAVENISYDDSRKIKKLLIAIAQSVPFTPNISKLSERLGMNRTFLINAIKLLDRADLVTELFRPTKGVGALTKPEKLYLNNTNLIYALAQKNAETGTLSETFFSNQMKGLHEMHLAEKGDFLIDQKYTFEIGGKGKSAKQIGGVPNSYVVRDDIEVGAINIIPLWLFGFMY
ncbi:MAG: AAA family ATPase [Pricia sp.]